MGSRAAPLLRRNSDQRQAATWASSPRTKLVLFFVSFALTYGAIRAWQIIIESDNIYLETAAAFITVVILFAIYWYLMRQYTAHRRRLNELRQAHPTSTPEEDVDLNMVQLRLYLRRVYGSSVNIDSLLANSGGLTLETIDSLVRNFTFSAGKGGAKVEDETDLELGLGRTESDMTSTPPISRYCSVDAVEYERVVGCSHMDERPPLNRFGSLSLPEECSVCLMEYNDGDLLAELPCHHTYHRSCVTEWLLRHNACPMCKQLVLPLPPLLTTSEEARAVGEAAATVGDSSARSVDAQYPPSLPTPEHGVGDRSESALPPVPVLDSTPPAAYSATATTPDATFAATTSATPAVTTGVVTPSTHAPLRVEDLEEEELRGPCYTP